jgi:hypothetical protein
LDTTKQFSFVPSIVVYVCNDIFAAALLKTDSIDMEIIEQSEEKKQQWGVNIGKHLNKNLNKLMWSQGL